MITAATITPVPKHRQQAALRFLADAQEADALQELRAESDLSPAHAPAALAVLAKRNLPVTAEEAVAVLAAHEPALLEVLRGLLSGGRRREALIFLRSTTGTGVVTARRIVARIAPTPPQGTDVGFRPGPAS
ncbi:hypothetical protein AB0O91_13285 [Kitasatospora sp. NPDC089797]|uniref:hypothetical protein n=1 Tax=Kitasatospora sp. NPDC089797 TaxID=3155298 RepID=UPI003449BB23